MSAHPVAAGNGNGDAILGVFGHRVNWHARGLPPHVNLSVPKRSRRIPRSCPSV